jgi:hypothetical protein
MKLRKYKIGNKTLAKEGQKNRLFIKQFLHDSENITVTNSKEQAAKSVMMFVRENRRTSG